MLQELPARLLSVEKQPSIAARELANEASFFLTKPASMSDLKNVCQYGMQRSETKEMIVGEQSGHVLQKTEEERMEEEKASAEKDHLRKDSKRKMNESEGESVEEEFRRRKKPRVVWTPALHVEFMDAIHQLGYDKAVPSTILEVMNRPELTRRNVASHLQKLRQHLRRINKDEVQNYHLDPLHLGLSSSGSLSPHKPMTPLNLFPQHPENTRYMNLLQQNRIPSTSVQQANANPTTAFFPRYWNTGSPFLGNRFTNQPSPYFDFSSMGGNTTAFSPHYGNTSSPFLANRFTNQPSPYFDFSSMGGNTGTPQFPNLLSTVRASNPNINPNNIGKQNVGTGLRLPPTPSFGLSNLGVGSNWMGSSGGGIGHLSSFHPQNHGRLGGVREDASSSTSQAAKNPNWFRFTK